ncbi:TIGR03086 family protein [Phytoactinopolyspora sp. XMNu-373]|uniref:TIGR03086 family protein n=2 Tax=Phytoactinopolyspora mesophila TaxID=2650750 RepID=A0A7K3M122_9ACTN|nr:TIGR03086 family protein [Phytoactinopolyspora mesophila]
MEGAATPAIAVVRGIEAGQLSAPTPCSEYDVHKLLNHVLFWGPSLESAARKEVFPPPADSDRDVDLVDAGWADTYERQSRRIAASWSQPEAWEGLTQLGSPMDLPASMIGGMVMGEFVVHGWDLARASGQQVMWDDDVLAFVYQEVEKTAEQGREMGVYAERVPVPADAPVLDQILGLTGRDPTWAPT